jgi:hypothetical protein
MKSWECRLPFCSESFVFPSHLHKLIEIKGVGHKMRRKIFGPKSEEVAEGWRRPQNEEIYNL